MTTASMFQDFLNNIKIERGDIIGDRYKAITKCLNKYFRDTDYETANSLQVGSYGRWTGIKGISDLDMIYIIPESKWETYKDDQYKILSDVREALLISYPRSDIKVDKLVVDLCFSDNTTFEIQPVFEIKDENDDIVYKYPDTYNKSWKITMPRQEQEEMRAINKNKNDNLRKLCKMLRAWKNSNGVVMSGLLIDTLAYNYINSTKDYDDKSYSSYDNLSKDFFEFLKDEPKKNYYLALGSKQRVTVKHFFNKKAKKAFEISKEACDETDNDKKQQKWKQLYGKNFPSVKKEEANESRYFDTSFQNTEEFIEDKYPVDIRYELCIDCKVKQDGFGDTLLRELIAKGFPLKHGRSLNFFIRYTDLHKPYEIIWKVRNCGSIAEHRNMIRGQLITTNKSEIKEHTDFDGPHYVECYLIKANVCVARAHIDVPIKEQ